MTSGCLYISRDGLETVASSTSRRQRRAGSARFGAAFSSRDLPRIWPRSPTSSGKYGEETWSATGRLEMAWSSSTGGVSRQCRGKVESQDQRKLWLDDAEHAGAPHVTPVQRDEYRFPQILVLERTYEDCGTVVGAEFSPGHPGQPPELTLSLIDYRAYSELLAESHRLISQARRRSAMRKVSG